MPIPIPRGFNAIAKSTPGAPTTGTWAVGDVVADSAGAYWRCTAAGTPGTWAGMGGGADFAADREVSASKAVRADDTRVRHPFAINYCTNPDGEIDTAGWSTYADAAGVQPVDGTGGSPTVSISRLTSSNIPRGSATLYVGKAAGASEQGQGWSHAFTIDRADRNRTLTVSFDMELVVGTWVADGWSVWVYDVTNNKLCPITGRNAITAPGTGLSFQFSTSDSTSYRLIIHIGTTDSGTIAAAIDNVYIGPTYLPSAPALSDWQAFTPSFDGLGTPTEVEAYWYRAGDRLGAQGKFRAGTTTASEFRLYLPNGFVIDGAKIADDGSNSARAVVGFIGRAVVGANLYTITARGGDNYVTYSLQDNSTYISTTALAANIGMGSNERFVFHIRDLPIVGWSGTTAVQPGSRYLWAQRFAANAVRVTTTPSKPGEYRSRRDTTDTTPTDGPSAANAFRIDAGSGLAAGRISWWDVYVGPGKVVQPVFHKDAGRSGLIETGFHINSTYFGCMTSYDPVTGVATVRTNVANASDCVGVNTIDRASVSACYFDLLVADDPVPVALAPAVHVEASSDAGQVVTADTEDIEYEDKAVDTHGAWSGSVFTAPVAGVYYCTFNFAPNTTLNATPKIFKNGAVYRQGPVNVASAGNSAGFSSSIKLAAGDTVRFRSGNGYTANGLATTNWLSITRIGDA